MKYFTIVFTIIATALIIFNLTQVNYEDPFKGDSIVALITIAAALCGTVLVHILYTSKEIEKKSKGRK